MYRPMVSGSLIKHIRSLEHKKFRNKHGCFVAQGDKIVRELLDSDFRLIHILALESWIDDNRDHRALTNTELTRVSEKQLERISMLKTPNRALAVAAIPEYSPDYSLNENEKKLTLVLDNIQDPGNLGTIIRTADWFGVSNIICSHESADVYNPKVIQATMGSFIRVKVHYTDLEAFLTQGQIKTPTFGAFLDGNDIAGEKAELPAILVIGNESRGISPPVRKHINHRISISRGRDRQNTAGPESLNAAMAAGILMAWFNQH